MKKFFLIALIATMFVACKDDEDPELREFYIQGVDNISYNKSADIHLQTAHEVVTYTDTIALFLTDDESGCGTWVTFTTGGDFDTGCNELDTINNRLSMYYLNFETFEDNFFLNAYNVYIVSIVNHFPKDTIAYVPKQQIEDVKKIIAPLWDNGKGREECFKYFQDAFFFYPCSASEYKEMMKNGTY